MKSALILTASLFFAASFSQLCVAQGPPPPPPPPSYPPAALDQMVARIALFPDPLLAQVLSASTFSDQIPDAANWADRHHYLKDQTLADAINNDQLPWDPSVQALLPFPSVLDMMASDPGWAAQLGNAVLVERDMVMDAVQRMRHRAMQYGYLHSGPEVVVAPGHYITILPVNPEIMYAPYYDPEIVYVAPRRGLAVATAINFGFGVTVGVAFRPWGWGLTRFDWGGHGWYIHNTLWGRNWANRTAYVHPYPFQRFDRGPRPAARPPERHQLIQRSPQERDMDRRNERREEEHRH